VWGYRVIQWDMEGCRVIQWDMEGCRVIQWDSQDYAEAGAVEVHMVGENDMKRAEVHKVWKVQRVLVNIPWVHFHGVVEYL